MNPDDLLLRDIHLPHPVSWWPPAIGWWLVIGLSVVCVAALFAWWRYRIALRKAPATLARSDLARLHTEWQQNHDAQWLVSEISVWLRRVSMSFSSRQSAASLTGSNWQQHLNELAGEQIFDAASGALLTAIPYRDKASIAADVDGEALLELCQRWLDAAARKVRRR